MYRKYITDYPLTFFSVFFWEMKIKCAQQLFNPQGLKQDRLLQKHRLIKYLFFTKIL